MNRRSPLQVLLLRERDNVKGKDLVEHNLAHL